MEDPNFLPEELIREIQYYLADRDLGSFQLASRRLNLAISEAEKLYRRYHHRDLIDLARIGDLTGVRYLVEYRGADIQMDAALRRASENGYLEVVKYLVEQGADIHSDNDYPLRAAASYGHLAVVNYLVENEANEILDEVLILAALNGQLEIVKYLVEQGADIHANNDYALQLAASYGNMPVVKYLVEQGAEITDEALILAGLRGHLEVVEYLQWALQR